MLLLKTVCTLILVNVAASIESSTEATGISYDPGELLAKIFNPNTSISSRQRGYGLVFENQPEPDPQTNPGGHYGLITFEDNQKLKFEDDQNNNSNQPLRFQDNSQNVDGNERPLKNQRLVRDQVTFQDENTIGQVNKRKRRRRRKPKNGLQNYQGVPNYHLQGVPSRPGFSDPGFEQSPYPVNPGFGPNPNGDPGFPRPFKRRRRPRPSLASDALTAVTGALTSIALYDDYQCVPRLLCEAAGGGSLGSAGVLDSITSIQPLLTLLSVYNGISTSPLFVFGRAVFLGMTSKGNTGTCRYAYPQCPTDPEQLIHYLNNHNGGFFRFFNAPLQNQNLEQFYNHLGQNGQFFGQDLDQNGQFNFGQDGHNQQFQQGQGAYGLYQNQQSGQGYGFQNNHIGIQRPSFYGQNYGSNYDYNTYGSNTRYKKSNDKIEKRIQNKPVKDDDDSSDDNDSFDTKWQFPEDTSSNTNDKGQSLLYSLDDDDDRDSDSLKFPEESQKYDDKRDYKRKGKSILFPENQYNHNAYSNKNYVNYDNQINYKTGQNDQIDYNKVTTRRPYYHSNYYYQNDGNGNAYKRTTAAPFNENDYYYDHTHNFYVKKAQNHENYNRYQNHLTNNNYYYNKEQNKLNYDNYHNNVHSHKEDGTQTVYIVRGNGDPNRPEIVIVKPGQTVN